VATDPVWSCTLLRAGAFRLDGGAMFGIIPRVLWEGLSPPDERHRIRLQTNCLLLEREGVRVLVETGYGNKFPEKERDQFALEDRSIIDALAERGLEPDAIDHVIVTHLHFDHAGGLTRSDEPGGPARPTFPRASIHVQRQEWEDARANRSTMNRTYLREHLDPVADRVVLLEGEGEILPGLWTGPAVGHTWGQQAIVADTPAGTVLFPGDVMPTRHHAGLAWNMAYDMLPHENMATKRRLLERAASEGWRIVIDHEPDEPIVRVAADADRPGRFRLEPADLEGAAP